MPRPLDLIATARRLLISAETGEISDCDIRRAVSTAYYAMFHAVAIKAADLFVGAPSTEEAQKAWIHVYRSVDHAMLKRACINSDLRASSPDEVAAFATMFEQMQTKRHKADYDPFSNFTRLTSLRDLNNVEQTLIGFLSAADDELRIFLAFALFKSRAN